MARLFGIETEYGIAVEGLGAAEMVRESAALVRAYAGRCVTQWNYRGESPRRDMRGFTVNQLASNPDDAQFDTTSAGGGVEDRADRVLCNGARFYNDHGHPEYATPECRTLMDLVAHDRAGERIVLECARARAEATGTPVRIYKNNTDYHGASYGTHEGYLMRRSVPAETLVWALAPFLATRQVFAGAGKVGVEGHRGAEHSGPVYQLSQRADFVAVEASVDTLHNRPLVNTRDEPHAAPREYRRLHVIVGDANMSEWSTAMKVGTTALVVWLLDAGWAPSMRLSAPVSAVQSISRDQTLQWRVCLQDGRTVSAIDVQRHFLEAARTELAARDEETDWVLDEWARVLDDLETDILRAADRVDWVAKRQLLESFMAQEAADWSSPIMQSLDLAYHDVDPLSGLFAGLEQAGCVRRLAPDAAIEAAMCRPPADTRAYMRGLLVDRHAEDVLSVGWNGVAFRHRGEDYVFDMSTLVEENVAVLNAEMGRTTDLDGVVACMGPANSR